MASKRQQNLLLYRYLRQAYDYSESFSATTLAGDREEFWLNLYTQRIQALFRGAPIAPLYTSDDIVFLRQWITEEEKSTTAIVEGNIDTLRIASETDNFVREHKAKLLEEFEQDYNNGILTELGLEAYATYLPLHFFLEDKGDDTPSWGIYISLQGILKLAAVIQEAAINLWGVPDQQAKINFTDVAYQILLRHELEHYKVESFALNAEMMLGEPIYTPYLMNVYTNTYCTDECLEEALANRTILDSTVIKEMFSKLYPERKPAVPWRDLICKLFLDHQPPGYRNYALTRWNPRGRDKERREAMNFLCNQVVQGQINPFEDIPFYAWPPDNHFLRAENLVPIYIVDTLEEHDTFIHLATPSATAWKRFMNALGYSLTDRGKGSHEVWVKPGWPELTISYKNKEIGYASYKQALRVFGVTPHEFERSNNRKALAQQILNNRSISQLSF